MTNVYHNIIQTFRQSVFSYDALQEKNNLTFFIYRDRMDENKCPLRQSEAVRRGFT